MNELQDKLFWLVLEWVTPTESRFWSQIPNPRSIYRYTKQTVSGLLEWVTPWDDLPRSKLRSELKRNRCEKKLFG